MNGVERAAAELIRHAGDTWVNKISFGHPLFRALIAAFEAGDFGETRRPTVEPGSAERYAEQERKARCAHSLLQLTGIGSERQCYECVKCGAVGLANAEGDERALTSTETLSDEAIEAFAQNMDRYDYMWRNVNDLREFLDEIRSKVIFFPRRVEGGVSRP